MIEEEIEVLEFNNLQEKKPKLSIRKKRTIVAIIIVLLCIATIFGVIKFFLGKDNTMFENAFFIENINGYYTLFDNKGNKLSDSLYKEVGEFIDGTTFVADEKLNYGIISAKGKMIVDYGKYQLITRKGSFYKAQMVNNNILLSSEGKEICDITNSDILLYGKNNFIIISENDKYKVINSKGNVLLEFDNNDKSKKPIVDEKDDYIIVYYDSINYIIDLANEKIIKQINESQRYCVYDVNQENRNNIIISSCAAEPNDMIKYNYKYLENGKIIIEKDSDKLAVMRFSGNNITYTKEKNTFLVKNDGSEGLNITGIQYIDQNNYARYDEKTLQINIYANGKVKTKVDCGYLAGRYISEGIYQFEKCSMKDDNGSYAFYNSSGNLIGTAYKKVTPFDDNMRAIVSKDGEQLYLIDESGKKVSKTYISIEKVDNLYVGTTKDNKIKIFDKDNAIKVEADSYVQKNFNNYSILLLKKGKKFIIYDLKADNKVASVSVYPLLEENYFTTSTPSQINYYSYATGKIFYQI